MRRSVRKGIAAWPVTAAITLAACAGQPDEAADGRTAGVSTDCFTISLADDFRYLDDDNLIVYAPAGRPYHVELSGVCTGLRGEIDIALTARTGRVCGFAGDAVVVDGAFTQRCPILSVRRLDEDQVQTLIDQFEGGDEAEGEFEVVVPPDEEEEQEE